MLHWPCGAATKTATTLSKQSGLWLWVIDNLVMDQILPAGRMLSIPAIQSFQPTTLNALKGALANLMACKIKMFVLMLVNLISFCGLHLNNMNLE